MHATVAQANPVPGSAATNCAAISSCAARMWQAARLAHGKASARATIATRSTRSRFPYCDANCLLLWMVSASNMTSTSRQSAGLGSKTTSKYRAGYAPNKAHASRRAPMRTLSGQQPVLAGATNG